MFMKYIVLVVLLFSAQLFGDKVIAYSNSNGYGFVKLLLTNPMYGKEEAKNRKAKVQYITNIKVMADDKLILNMKTSPFMSKNPFLAFSYKNIIPSNVILISQDNYNVIKKVTRKIKLLKKDDKRLNRWKIKNLPTLNISKKLSSSIRKVYGDIELIEEHVGLKTPRLSENASAIPIKIKSDINVKSVTLFAEVNKNINNGELLFICQWISTPYSVVNYQTKIKMADTGTVQVVIEGEDGKFYTAKTIVEVSVAGLNCGG